MITLGFVIGTLLVLVGFGAGELLRLRRERSESGFRERSESGFRERYGRVVAVHLHGKISVRGVLVRSYVDGIALEHPRWISDAQPHELGGQLFVPHREIAFLQVFDPGEPEGPPRDPGKRTS